MKIAVGMSGGVDSSVAAALLQRDGNEVFGVTMTLWKDGKYSGVDKNNQCRDACFGPGEKDDVARAARICERLKIPHYVFDCADEYEQTVLAYFRDEYRAGKTPNPCVRCNGLMKFGVLLTRAKNSGLEFDKFATGHYVRVGKNLDRHALFAARDHAKDQSYFLFRLTQAQIGAAIFPLGELAKNTVREIARELNLETADLPDSQDFYSGDHCELLNLPDREGDIVDQLGKPLGKHRGFWHYTIGQRKGLGIAAKEPLYVLALDADKNAVIVGSAEDAHGDEFLLDDLHWTSIVAPVAEFSAAVKIRSAATAVAASISPLENGVWRVVSQSPLNAIAPGQSAVFYAGDLLLGGGRVLNRELK